MVPVIESMFNFVYKNCLNLVHTDHFLTIFQPRMDVPAPLKPDGQKPSEDIAVRAQKVLSYIHTRYAHLHTRYAHSHTRTHAWSCLSHHVEFCSNESSSLMFPAFRFALVAFGGYEIVDSSPPTLPDAVACQDPD